MLRDNKNRYSPETWGYGIVHMHMLGVELDLRNESSVLQDRYRRGMAEWSKLLDLPWWAWRRDREVLRRLEALRQEYREMLAPLADAHFRKRAVHVPYPSKATFVRPNQHGKTERVSREEYKRYLHQEPVIVPMDDDDRKRQVEGAFYGTYDAFKSAPAPAAPAAHTDHSSSYSGHGGHYGGAGASGDFGATDCGSGSSDSGPSGGGESDCCGGSCD